MTGRKIPKSEGDSSIKKALLIALIAMVVLLVGWHLLLPILGVAAVFTAGAWGVIMATIVLVAAAVLLFYIFSGIGILIVCVLSGVWIVFSIALFPFIFPLLIPLLILLVFIAFVRRKQIK